jgi:hypothetical protein
MKHMLNPARRFRLFPILFGLALCAQDAGMVLRTSVGYNTQKATLALSEEQRAEAKKAGAKVVYVEVPGGSHIDIVVPQLGPMLDFFAAQARRSPT